MSLHLNLSTGKFLNSSTLFKLSDALLLDVSSGEIVMSNLLVPRAGVDLFKLASLDLNFSQRKTLTDSVSGTNLITFSRASSGTYVDSDGLIKTAVTDAPRFDHDPVTGESLGLLIEESRTNLLTYSEQFDDGSYITAGFPVVAPTKTPNQATAPDGSLTADKIDYPAVSEANTYSLVFRAAATLSGSHSSSIYLRGAVGGEKLYLFYFVDGVYSNTLCTLTTEWQRFSVIFTGGTSSYWHLGVDLRSGSGQVAQSASTIYAWGAQLEAGSFPTSYIPTTSSTVTRSPDIATIEGTNFSSWYNQSEGTVFVEAKNYPHPVTGKALVPFAFSDNTYNNRITLAGSTGTAQFNFDVVSAGSLSRAILGNFVSSGLKASGGYKSTGSAGSLDGAAAVTSNTPNIPSVIGQLDIGRSHDGINILNGHISRLAYFPTRKTDQELIDLTT